MRAQKIRLQGPLDMSTWSFIGGIRAYAQRHELSNNVVCATSKASVQPAHTPSLIKAFACRLNIL